MASTSATLNQQNYDKKGKATQGFYAAFSKTTEYFFTAPRFLGL